MFSEYGKQLPACKKWLLQNHEAFFNEIYPEEAVVDQLAESSIEDKKDEKPRKGSSKKKSTKREVVIKITSRSKKKRVTTIKGLHQYENVDMKKAAKQFAGRFACGSSVTQSASGEDEITIQGDFTDTLINILVKDYAIPRGDIVIKEK